MRRSRRRILVARVGAVLLTLPMSVTLLAPVAAQEVDPEPTSIDASAVYVTSGTAVLPKTITNDVPPTAACIVVPEACPPELDPIRDPSRDLVGGAAGQDVQTPAQPIPPDTIAVSVLSGTTRHQAAVLFETPTAPAGEEITSFDLVLTQTEPTFDMDSPSFRRMILAVFQTIATEDPQFIFDGFVDALSNESPADLSQKLGIEACALLEPFEPSEAPQTQSDEDLPRDEETGEPAIDCVLGAIGSFDEGALTWTFDLRFAARAWAEGELENNGILLRPIGVQNLAYGDPDPTTSAQVTLDITNASTGTATAPPPTRSPPVPIPNDDEPTLSGGSDFAPGDSVPLGVPQVGQPPVQPQSPSQPVVTPPPAAAPSIVDTLAAAGEAENPWWIWLVLLAFLVGIRLGAAGFAGAEDDFDDQLPGALSHLLARRIRPVGDGG